MVTQEPPVNTYTLGREKYVLRLFDLPRNVKPLGRLINPAMPIRNLWDWDGKLVITNLDGTDYWEWGYSRG